MGRWRQYGWPRAIFIFWSDRGEVYAAFGLIEKGHLEVMVQRTFLASQKEALVAWYEEIVYTYPRTYVTTLLSSLNQGGVPGCSKNTLDRMEVDRTLVQTVCIDNLWLLYTSIVEMKWHEKRFPELPIDLLYSPFVLLWHLLKSSLDRRVTLGALRIGELLYVAILSNQKLWYTHAVAINEKDDEKEEGIEELEGSEEVAFDLDLIDDETVTPITDADTLEDFEESVEEKEETASEEDLAKLSQTLALHEALKVSIKRFYHDDRFESAFVERVALFEVGQESPDIVRYLEDELFLEATTRTCNLTALLGELAVADLEQ